MRCLLILTTSLTLVLDAQQVQAGGSAIQLSAVRLTVGPRQRTASVILSNQTPKEQRYRLSIIDMVMDINGRVSASGADKTSKAHSASQWVLATPASFHLAPGQSQKIRLLVRRPGRLSDGEYRAHLRVAQQPPADISGGLREEVPAERGLQLVIATVHAATLPIFIRQGQTYSTASIAEAHLVDGGKRVMLELKREGNASFRGFVQARTGNSKPMYLPCVIYPERDRLNLAYDMSALMNTMEPIILSLYSGAIPQPGTTPTEDTLSSFTLTR